MKRIKSLAALLLAVVLVVSSLPIAFLASAAGDYVEYIDFSKTFGGRASNEVDPDWFYLTTTGNGKTKLVAERIEFSESTNVGNSYGDRAVLLSNDYKTKHITSGKKYKVVFDLFVTDNTYSELSYGFKYVADVWNSIQGTHEIVDKISSLTVENKTTTDAFTVYTLSMILIAPTLSDDCNLALSIYGNGSGNKYYLDNVYIYSADEYVLTDENGSRLGSLYGFAGEAIADSIEGCAFDKIGYAYTLNFEKFPQNTSEEIIIKYTKQENLVCDIDFDENYAENNSDKYIPGSSAYVLLQNGTVKFADTCSETVNFADRAVLLADDYQNSTLKEKQKYCLTFTIKSWSNIDTYTLQLKYGSDLSKPTLDEGVIVGGEELENCVVSETEQSDGSTVYAVNVDIETPADWNASVKNLLVSIYGGTHCYLDNVLIRTYFTYEVADTNGKSLGTITALAGDGVADKIAYFEFLIPDFKCVPVTEKFPQKSTEKVILKYTEITNILEYIDFGESYADGTPGWQYVGGETSTLVYSKGQIEFKGEVNSGKSYGDRAVLLANDRTTTEIKAGQRYQLQFDLYLVNEELSTKTVDIRFGKDVWNFNSEYSLVEKVSNLNLISTRTEDGKTVYTLSVILTAPSDDNILLSVYGNGQSNSFYLKDVCIYKEFAYTCVDADGNELGQLYAFPGEEITDLISGSQVDKKGYFETANMKNAPLKSSQKITISYKKDNSFVSFIDFGSGYAVGSQNRYLANSAGTNVNIVTLDKSGKNISVAANNRGKDDSFRYRSFVLANDYKNSGLVSGEYYLVTFELTLPNTADVSNFGVEFRSGRYAGLGLGNGNADADSKVYSGVEIKNSIISQKASGKNTVYTVALSYTLADDGWGTASERNMLMSLFGGNAAATIDNLDISLASEVKLENTDLASVVGKIGYPLVLPDEIFKKDNIFVGWYEDAEFKNAFSLKTFPETNTAAYAYFKEVDVEAEMNFTLTPPSRANLTGFKHHLLGGNISTLTDMAGVAYLNMFSGGNLIQISPANFYPVYFRFKTEGYNGKITFGLASAAETDFNKAQNIIATTTVSASGKWTSASMCATPEILIENGVKGEYLYFFVRFDSDVGGKIYVDDILLSQKTSISFNTNGGNKLDSLKGQPGDEITLPTPTNAGKTFSGWFYDSALTSRVKGASAVYPTAKCNITLYAGWDLADTAVTVEDFEAYDMSLINNSANQRSKEVFSVSSKFAYSGNTAMHYKYDPAQSKALSAQESTVKLTGNSGASGNGITVENGKDYVMTLYIYAKALDCPVEIQLSTAQENDINKNYKVQSTQAGAARISQLYNGENVWQKVQYVFTGAVDTEAANELFLSVCAKSEVYTELYIDCVSIEKLTADMGAVAFYNWIYDSSLYEMEYRYLAGKVGESFDFPEGLRENYKLLGWYGDYTYQKKFSPVFENGIKTAHAQWDIDGSVTVDFEKPGHYPQDGEGTPTDWSLTNIRGGAVVSGEKASNGSGSYKIDSNNRYWTSEFKALALKETDGSPLRLVDNTTYIISVDIYVESYSSDFTFWFATGSQTNYYAWQGTESGKINVNADVPTGKWITTSMTYSTAFSFSGGFNLFLCSGGPKGTVVYYDNIKIESLDENSITVLMSTGLLGGSTRRITGNPGEEYKLPSTVNVSGYKFFGWYNSPSLEKMVSYEDIFAFTRTVYAKLAPSVIRQDFENYTGNFEIIRGGDEDYEIYNPDIVGYTADNVHNGSSSLHRKGLSHQFKNAVIVRKNAQLSPGDVYELTMWVKMDSFDHTKGAIKIGSCSSPNFAWDLTDELKAVAAISDLTDKQWHKVTFRFMSSAYYLVLQTPGYCSIYIDDITVKHLGAVTPDDSVAFTEYVPVKKDANGKIPAITTEAAPTITDSRLEVYSRFNELLELYGDYNQDDEREKSTITTRTKKKSTSVTRERNPLTFKDILTCNSYVWYTVVFYSSVGAILVAAALVIVLLHIRKKCKGRISK